MEEKERFEYYPKQNQLYDNIINELYCLGIKQDKTRLVDFLNLMNKDWRTLYERNIELREENQQLKQQLAEKDAERELDNSFWKQECDSLQKTLVEKDKEIEKLNACVDFYKSYYVSFQEKVIDELERVKEKILPEISSYVKKEFVVKEFDNQIKQLTHQHEDKGE